MGVQFDRFMTPAGLEKVMELGAGSIDPITWLVIQECASGVSPKSLAEGLLISEEDLAGIANALTGESEGFNGQMWKNCVMVVKASAQMNQQTIAGGWDGIEALAVQRLGRFMQDNSTNMTVKDALEIATVANKANRRHLGEGSRAGMSLSVRQGGAGNPGDLDVELRSGNLGSIRMSLSQRVQAQLATPRVIDAESRAISREMLSLDDTRKLVDAKATG